MNVIDSFSDEYDFLSNFYITPVYFDGLMYNCSECAYQSAKTIAITSRYRFVDMPPGKAKREGKKLSLRPDWDKVKDYIMLEIVRDKFKRNPEIAQKLLDTGDAMIVEGNYWHDEYWGVCNGKGLNKLGMILMQVRQELRQSTI